jgi:aspartyl/asparaginyl-tRNA synthetase
MDEGKARTLALLCSIAGLAVLYFSSAMAEQASAPAEIRTLSMDSVGTNAKICGSVAEAKASKGNIFFQLQDNTSSMRVVIFNSTASRMNVSGILERSSMCVLGQVQEYPPGSGAIELVANKVTFI